MGAHGESTGGVKRDSDVSETQATHSKQQGHADPLVSCISCLFVCLYICCCCLFVVVCSEWVLLSEAGSLRNTAG